jgi:phenylacetate-CoA ligase
MGVMGQDTDENRDMVLNHGSYHFELLYPENDEPVGPGEAGRIVITDLFNYALPMIRYDTGDIGVWREDAGQLLQSRFSEVRGRQWDIIYDTKGAPISPHVLAAAGWCLKSAQQFQFIQEARDRYTLRISAKDLSGCEEALAKIKGALGSDAQIEVVCVDEIPILNSGKRRMTVSNWQRAK